jgi:hypothetical protein
MKNRDPLLDLWRGLALIDMTWVHLAYVIGLTPWLMLWIGHYTRFAAGAFVLIAGISVARTFGVNLQSSNRATVQSTHWRLLRRALLLASLDRLVAVAYVVIDQFRLIPPLVTPNPPEVLDLLCFRAPGVTGGLLFLYALLLTATPLFDAVQRRFGGSVLIAASLSIYAIAYTSGATLQDAAWPFPVLYWQVLFVMGYAISQPLAHWRAGGGQVSARWLVLSTGSFALLFLVRNGTALGLPIPPPMGDLAFVKAPLNPAELIWYLAISNFVLTWSAWAWAQAAEPQQSLNRLCQLGRQSLLVYVAHLFIEPPILELLTLVDPTPLTRAATLPLAVVVLVAVAAAGERFKRVRLAMLTLPAGAHHRGAVGGLIGSTVAVSAVAMVITLQVVVGPPANWTSAPIATDGEVILATDEGAYTELTPYEESLNESEPVLFDADQESEGSRSVSET